MKVGLWEGYVDMLTHTNRPEAWVCMGTFLQDSYIYLSLDICTRAR